MKLPKPSLLAPIAVLLLAATGAGPEWHHPLDRDGGGYWRQRVAVSLKNETPQPLQGRAVSVPVGTGAGQVPLVGAAAEAVRVCNDQGLEMLYAITGPDGSPRTRGPIAAGSSLTLPFEAAPKSTAALYVYFDNSSAGEGSESLPARVGLVNGDLEQGEGAAPDGWRHDEGDDRHRSTWGTERPHSGRRCFKTVVAEGSEPTWISARQHEIPIVGGARYRMEGWVAAKDVKGTSGWYIHVGTHEQPMLISPMLDAGRGTFDWKKVSVEFKAPPEADVADLGTVLHGTGTAWFDSVSLTCLDLKSTGVAVGPVERIKVRETGEGPWPDDASLDVRAAVRVANLGIEAFSRSLAAVDLATLQRRSRGRFRRESVRIRYEGRPVPLAFQGDMLLFPANVPARTMATFYVYDSETSKPPASERIALGSGYDLVKNGGFEDGAATPSSWRAVQPEPTPGVSFTVDDPKRPELGRRCARLSIRSSVPSAWRGWQQDVAVRPGHTYLVSAAVKCEDVEGGEVQVHTHRHRADGELTSQEPMASLGPPIHGTADWTWMSGLMTMPPEAVSLQIHLSTNRSGTIWHDAVSASEVVPSTVTKLEHRPAPDDGAPRLWSVPAIVKVFPEDVPPPRPAAARIAAARNEREPLQIAVRSRSERKKVRVEVDPPTGPRGARLTDVEINVVGYVPIDAPTNYYQSKTPAWHRKSPRGGGQSDGWAGLWPDPLLPRAEFDLAPDSTQPVWATFDVGATAEPGDYRGTIRLVEAGKAVASLPFVVHVWGYTLPEASHVKAIFDIGPGPGGERFWSAGTQEEYAQIAPFMARRRTSPNRILPDPVFQYRDGRATADFTEYDVAARRYFEEWKIPHSYMPQFFYLFGWGFPPKDCFGEKPYDGEPPFEGVDRSRLRPEYKKVYQACLKLFWDHVTAEGWRDRYVLYISDEPFYDREPIRVQMKALCAMIHEVDAKIPVYSSTWHHVPEWDGSLDVWGIGNYGVVPPETIAAIRKRGARVWFTTDGHMCTDTPYCAVERLMPYYCFAHEAEAYEFWGVNWLTIDPYRFGWHAYINQTDAPGQSYWVRYPNGDGYLLYPGAPFGRKGPVSSVRFEQASEGVEDYQALALLRGLVADAKKARRPTEAAEKALAGAVKLVPIPNAGGKYSTKILPDPAAVYESREAVARAIEGLQRP